MAFKLRRTAIALAAIGGTLLAGCSTYVGHRLNADGAFPKSDTGGSLTSGLPFTMTRPEYVLDVTADAEDPSKAIYTLKVNYVPDSSQRYTLALSPALLTDGKFDVTYGELGNLSDATSTTKSQVVATITALTNLAVSSISAGVLKDEGSALSSFTDKLEENNGGVCKISPKARDLNVPRSAKNPILTPAEEKAAEASAADQAKVLTVKIRDDISAIVKRGELAKKDSGKALAVQEYHYKSDAQKNCLKAVRAAVYADQQGIISEYLGKYQAAAQIKDHDQKIASAAVQQKLPDWVKANDVDAITNAIKFVKGDTKLVLILEAAAEYLKFKAEAEAKMNVARKIADMPPAEWRARFIKALDRDIDETRQQRLMATDATTRSQMDVALSMLKTERANAIGGLALYLRRQKIDIFLSDVKTTAAEGGLSRYAADEHVKMREERDRINAQLKELGVSALSTGGTKNDQKVTPQSNVTTRIVSASFITKVNTTSSAVYKDLPEYAVVLEKVPPPAMGQPDSNFEEVLAKKNLAAQGAK